MHVRNSYFSLPVEVFGGKMPANWLFKCWLLLLLSLAMKGAASNDPDEDEIIQQAMAEDHHLMVNDLIKRAETNYNINDVNDIQVQEVPPPGVAPQKLHKGPGAENIVGDMKKYGLWEYSTDTTGMGDQLKEMIKNSKDVDPQADVSSDTLLKHAEKINTEINKYAEQLPTQGPTIDPYDTPLGYQPPPVNPSNPEVKQHETDNVINLPETPIVVEDEHGNNLDNFQQKGGPPTTPKPSATAAMASGMSSPQPTTALTLKLLNALKNSKSFLLNAQKLLDAPGDTDEELFNKQKSLLNYLKDYETDKTQAKANQEKEVHLLKPKVEVKLANTSGDNSNVLNRVVQYLSAHDPATKVSDILGVLKKAVDGVGPPGSKPAEEVNSIKSPPGTPDKPLKPDLSPTKKPVIPTKTLTTTQKPKPTQTSLNPLGLSGSSLNPLSLAGMSMDKVGVAGSHMTPTKSSKADDNNGISKDMLDMIFKMYNKEKKEEQTGDEKTHDDGSKPSSAGPLGIDKVNEKVSAANDKDKNTDKEKLMLDKLMQLTNKGDDLHKLTEANGHIETKDMNQKTNDVSSSSHQDKEKEKEKEKPVPPKIETTYTSTTTTNNNNNKTKEDAVGDKMYEYLKNTNEFKKLVAEHMKMFESANNLTHIQDVGPTINNKTKESKEQGSIPNESVKNITSSSKGPVATDQPKQNDKAEPPSTQSQQNVKIEAKPEEAIQSPQPASSNGGEKIDPNLSKKLEEIRKEKERLQREEEELKKMQQKPSNPEPLANTDNIKPNVIGNVDHQAQLMRERQPEDLTEAISNGIPVGLPMNTARRGDKKDQDKSSDHQRVVLGELKQMLSSAIYGGKQSQNNCGTTMTNAAKRNLLKMFSGTTTNAAKRNLLKLFSETTTNASKRNLLKMFSGTTTNASKRNLLKMFGYYKHFRKGTGNSRFKRLKRSLLESNCSPPPPDNVSSVNFDKNRAEQVINTNLETAKETAVKEANEIVISKYVNSEPSDKYFKGYQGQSPFSVKVDKEEVAKVINKQLRQIRTTPDRSEENESDETNQKTNIEHMDHKEMVDAENYMKNTEDGTIKVRVSSDEEGWHDGGMDVKYKLTDAKPEVELKPVKNSKVSQENVEYKIVREKDKDNSESKDQIGEEEQGGKTKKNRDEVSAGSDQDYLKDKSELETTTQTTKDNHTDSDGNQQKTNEDQSKGEDHLIKPEKDEEDTSGRGKANETVNATSSKELSDFLRHDKSDLTTGPMTVSKEKAEWIINEKLSKAFSNPEYTGGLREYLNASRHVQKEKLEDKTDDSFTNKIYFKNTKGLKEKMAQKLRFLNSGKPYTKSNETNGKNKKLKGEETKEENANVALKKNKTEEAPKGNNTGATENYHNVSVVSDISNSKVTELGNGVQVEPSPAEVGIAEKNNQGSGNGGTTSTTGSLWTKPKPSTKVDHMLRLASPSPNMTYPKEDPDAESHTRHPLHGNKSGNSTKVDHMLDLASPRRNANNNSHPGHIDPEETKHPLHDNDKTPNLISYDTFRMNNEKEGSYGNGLGIKHAYHKGANAPYKPYEYYNFVSHR